MCTTVYIKPNNCTNKCNKSNPINFILIYLGYLSVCCDNLVFAVLEKKTKLLSIFVCTCNLVSGFQTAD